MGEEFVYLVKDLVGEIRRLYERVFALGATCKLIKELISLYESGHLDANEVMEKIRELLKEPVVEEKIISIEFDRLGKEDVESD